jgi:ABC-type transporter Mla MlaB component
MAIRPVFESQRETVTLYFDGDLDLTLSRDIFAVCNLPWSGMSHCILDMRQVHRVFDSGVALTLMLARRLARQGLQVETRAAPDSVTRWLDSAAARKAAGALG